MDALNRRRDVYSRLATALRVFVDSNKHPDEKEKKEFLKAYDEGCLWASEAVIQALGKLIDIMQLNSKAKGMVSQSDMRAAYTECVLAMRKDSGFPDSNFEYRFVTFQ